MPGSVSMFAEKVAAPHANTLFCINILLFCACCCHLAMYYYESQDNGHAGSLLSRVLLTFHCTCTSFCKTWCVCTKFLQDMMCLHQQATMAAICCVVAHNLEVSQEGCVFLFIGTRRTTNNWAWARKYRLSWVCSQKLKQTLCHNTYAASRGCSYVNEALTMFSSL